MEYLQSLYKEINRIDEDDERMPPGFKAMVSPPQELYFLGDLSLLQKKRISIVGSRNPTPQSIHWMRVHLTELFIDNSLVSISGGARGVDSYVHQLSMDQSCPTVAFLPSGIRQPYPKSSIEIYEKILQRGGCLISEFPPDEEMKKYHFFMRNRLIAASSELLLLIQAGLPSGSYMSAGWAMKHGKTIACLPSFPDSPQFAGNLKLLFEGAQLIRECEDLRQLLEICDKAPPSTK